MANKQIAIKWAADTVKNASGFVYSDQFFLPFTNVITRRKIRDDLATKGVIVWSDTKTGAFLFRSGDSRLRVETHAGLRVAVWIENGDCMILPAEQI